MSVVKARVRVQVRIGVRVRVLGGVRVKVREMKQPVGS